jgi:hypothetical protein
MARTHEEIQIGIKQDRQYTCDVPLRRVHETTVAVEKQYVLYTGLCVHAYRCVQPCYSSTQRVCAIL